MALSASAEMGQSHPQKIYCACSTLVPQQLPSLGVESQQS